MAFVERLQKEETTEDKNEMRSNAWEDDEVEDTRGTQALEVAAHPVLYLKPRGIHVNPYHL
jgi:hypothetical protein